MSMDRCNGCDRPVDTNEDPDCYRMLVNPKVPWTVYTEDSVCLCEWCREDEAEAGHKRICEAVRSGTLSPLADQR